MKQKGSIDFGDGLWYDVKQFIVMALNGTLVRGSDRNAASPTESAAAQDWAKGTLWSWYIEAALPEGDATGWQD